MTMHRFVFNFSIIAVLCCCSSTITLGQKEYLVTVQPNTGSFSIIDSLPEVEQIQIMPAYTTFDETNHHFIFKGIDSGGDNRLYTIDAPTGAILYNPLFPQLGDASDNIIETQFDSQLNMLYGLHWDNSEQREYFVSINPVSGIHTLIDSLPGVHAIATGLTTYDDNNHYYIFHGVDNSGNQHIYTVDVSNGSIVAQPIITSADNLGIMQYDTESNDLYALKWDASTQTEYIVQLDQYTGSYSVVCNVPGVQSIVVFPSYATYNSNDHQFIFRGGISGDWRLFSVDVQSGQVISNPVFPVLSDPNDNLIELQYDNTSAVLYGLHWDNYSSTAGIDQKIAVPEVQIFPNPFSEQCTLELGQSYGEISVFLYDESGRLVSEQNAVNASSVTLSRGNLCPGTYHTVIIGDHILLGNSKLSVF